MNDENEKEMHVVCSGAISNLPRVIPRILLASEPRIGEWENLQDSTSQCHPILQDARCVPHGVLLQVASELRLQAVLDLLFALFTRFEVGRSAVCPPHTIAPVKAKELYFPKYSCFH